MSSLAISKYYCYFAFNVIESRLNLSQKLQPLNHFLAKESDGTLLLNPDIKYPLFVTFEYTDTHDLRGCIGTFSPRKTLEHELSDYTKIAAFNDSRFSPIQIDELKTLSCSVTILSNFEDRGADIWDFEIGKHGVILKEVKTGKNATFLPQVMTENNWGKVETLKQLSRKAGIRNYETGCILTVYEGRKNSVDFSEYSKFI